MGFFILVTIGIGIVISVKAFSNNSNSKENVSGLNYKVIDDTPYKPYSERTETQYDKTALRCEKGKGLIGYFHLEEWFNKTFTEEEIAYIKEKLSRTMMNPDQLNKGIITSTNQNIVQFLDSMSYTLNTKKDIHLALLFLEKSEDFIDLSKMSAYDIHFLCINRIEVYYKDRENKESFEKAIYWCKKMIEVAPQAYTEIKEYEKNLYTEEDKKTLPKELLNATATNGHKGFEQLAIIEYKRGNYQEVINICKQAKKSKFKGDWNRRIEQAQKKLEKQN